MDSKLNIHFADFGISKFSHETVNTNVQGCSDKYAPYEQIYVKNLASPKNDIWSLGIVLYELFS